MGASFSPQEMDLLSNLFLRAGMFVSRCDNTDINNDSENLEKSNLVRALNRVAAVSKDDLIVAVAEKARAGKVPPRENKEALTRDITEAVGLFHERNALDSLNEYRKALMYVATMVARAYCEELDRHEDEFLMESFMVKLSGRLNSDVDKKEFKNENISVAENTALNIISKALRT